MSNNQVLSRYGCIYKIYHSTKPECIYVGSTETSLSHRLRMHISSAKNRKKRSKWHQYLHDNNYQGFVIECLEHMTNYTNRSDLNVKEQEYIALLKPQLNSAPAYLTPEEKHARSYHEIKKDIRFSCTTCNYHTHFKGALDLHNKTQLHSIHLTLAGLQPQAVQRLSEEKQQSAEL